MLMRHELSLYLKTLNPILSKDEHPGRVSAVLNIWYLSVGVTASVSLDKNSFSQSPFRDDCLLTWPGFPGNSKLGHTLSHRSLRKLIMPWYFTIYLCLWNYLLNSDAVLYKYLFSLGFILPLKWVCIYSCCMFICCSMPRCPISPILWHRINNHPGKDANWIQKWKHRKRSFV